ncbi:MAG: hypothetical protein IPL61_36715 [Myxococcales bacterium]|nr:hypothetical protein [Myxococcales bacterium]
MPRPAAAARALVALVLIATPPLALALPGPDPTAPRRPTIGRTAPRPQAAGDHTRDDPEQAEPALAVDVVGFGGVGAYRSPLADRQPMVLGVAGTLGFHLAGQLTVGLRLAGTRLTTDPAAMPRTETFGLGALAVDYRVRPRLWLGGGLGLALLRADANEIATGLTARAALDVWRAAPVTVRVNIDGVLGLFDDRRFAMAVAGLGVQYR